MIVLSKNTKNMSEITLKYRVRYIKINKRHFINAIIILMVICKKNRVMKYF